jgi:CO/xanthine dehydrogenase Mo-binding subunit/aerobic-type carbon monoxide dehydrogenase small subunit (CoxS/CutS family)
LTDRAPLLRLTVNGASRFATPLKGASLQMVLQGALDCAEVRYGCGEGVCGACTILLDDCPVASCLVPPDRAEGRSVVTARALGALPGRAGEVARSLRAHLLARSAFQCGFCAPGMLVAATRLLTDRSDTIDEAAVRTGLAGNLCRCTGYEAIIRAVLAAARGEEVPDAAPRPDLEARLDGAVAFPGDAPPEAWDALVAGSLRAPAASARILAVDATAARALPGVVCVLTAADLPGRNCAGNDVFAADQPLLAAERVRCVSDVVALVAARSPAALRAALAAIEVRHAPETPVTDLDVASADRPRVFADRSNIIAQFQKNRGDVDAAFAQAETIIEASFDCAQAEHVCLEPDGGVARWEGETLVLRVQSQTPYGARAIAAAAAGLPRVRLRIEAPRAGGSFGRHMVGGFEAHLAALAAVTRRNVWMLPSRVETTRAGPKRHGFRGRYRLALFRGVITALEAELLADAGPYVSVTPTIVALFAAEATGPYDIAALRVVARGVRTNNPVAAPMRGYGCLQTGFAIERLMDIAAARIGADPVAFRRQHLKRMRSDGHGRATLPADGLLRVLDEAHEQAGPPPPPPEGWVTGRGIAVIHAKYGYPYGMVDRTVAEVSVDRSGRFLVRSDIPDAGSGTAAMAVRRVALRLGLSSPPTYAVAQELVDDPSGTVWALGRPPGIIRRALFDAIEWWVTTGMGGLLLRAAVLKPRRFRRLLALGTPLINFAYAGSNWIKYSLFPLARDTAAPRVSGSRGMRLLGAAVENALDVFGRAALLEAGRAFGQPAQGLTLVADGVRAPDGALLGWSELVTRAGGRFAAIGMAQNRPGRLLEPGTGNQLGPTDFMDACHICDVALDPATGETRVLRYLAVHDLGMVHDDDLVRGQIHGGIAMGLGQAVGEVCAMHEGRVLSGSLLDLMAPTALDVPAEICIRLIETGTGHGPSGAKGIGEAAAVAAPIALAAAVSRASGMQVSAIPLSPADIFAALASVQVSGSAGNARR